MSTTIGAWVLCMRAPVVLLHWCFGVTLVPRSAKEQHLHRRPPTPRGAHTATYVPACFVGEAESTTVTKPAVHAVMTANHVNPKL